MSEILTTEMAPSPDISHIVTEDNTPVDNFGSEKQQRLLTRVLYSSWAVAEGSQKFLVAANVGVFPAIAQPPIVPDVFLSLDVGVAENWWEKKNRSYFVWEFGKPPEVVIEIVSNREGNELGSKLRDYERMRVSYYVVFDPIQQLGGPVLQIYQLQGTRYLPMTDTWLEQVGLGLTLWHGVFEDKEDTWLRWCDRNGNLIPTGTERADRAESQLRETESLLEQERRRAELLTERLRALGIDPEQLNQ
ncbi:MAG: Uma2 family endonuclease [Microcoleus vaginatus WJT46-NPBG5]|jgi:hypothetical protein|nr:Uma2 family endonuclease [Microcoleus vaginatus WJT46-NPBG5]